MPSGAGLPSTFLSKTRSSRFLLGAAISLAPLAGQAQSELIRNGGFNEILVDWTVPAALAGDSPYVHEAPGGYLSFSLQDFGYQGTLLRQNLNVPSIANQTMIASIDMKSRWEFPDSDTIELSLEFSLSNGSIAQETVVIPDNSMIVNSSFTTVSESFTFPADAERLLALTIEKVGDGSYFGDNVSLTSSLTPEVLPILGQVSPSQVTYGDTVQINGSGFGAIQGSVLISDSEAGVVINSWSDTLIEMTVNDPCGGGLTSVVLPNKVRTGESRNIEITSPHFTATRFRASGFDQELTVPIAVPG